MSGTQDGHHGSNASTLHTLKVVLDVRVRQSALGFAGDAMSTGCAGRRLDGNGRCWRPCSRMADPECIFGTVLSRQSLARSALSATAAGGAPAILYGQVMAAADVCRASHAARAFGITLADDSRSAGTGRTGGDDCSARQTQLLPQPHPVPSLYLADCCCARVPCACSTTAEPWPGVPVMPGRVGVHTACVLGSPAEVSNASSLTEDAAAALQRSFVTSELRMYGVKRGSNPTPKVCIRVYVGCCPTRPVEYMDRRPVPLAASRVMALPLPCRCPCPYDWP